MKKLEAVIQPHKLDEVKTALIEMEGLGIPEIGSLAYLEFQLT